MSKQFFYLTVILPVLLFSLMNFQCKKDAVDGFCTVQRTDHLQVNNKEGIVVYYQKYDRWAIYSSINIAGNIDSKMIGLSCDIPSDMKIEGLAITFSGTFKKFNSDENITPQMGGEELYFLSLMQFSKKP